jgi:DNA-binding CsgD family transcriptional regulator
MSIQMTTSGVRHAAAEGVSTWVHSILDQIDYGLVLVGREGVIHLNRAARAEFETLHYPLHIDGGRLRAVDAVQDLQLGSAVNEALQSARRRLLTLRGAGRSLPIAVVPLAGEATHMVFAAALVVLGKRQLCSQLSEQWFCMAHGLTPAESSVLADLLAGHVPSSIARRNGVAISTVRTHIASIRGKTATGGIRELMMAAAALPPMVSITHGAGVVASLQ